MYVDIQYKCQNCGSEFFMSYDYGEDGTMEDNKYHRHYDKRSKDINLPNKGIYYRHIREMFDDLSDYKYTSLNYSKNCKSCGTFADEFTEKIRYW